MKISIIIIASNNEDTIYECLNSVQQFDEVIVYLNNSQDNTKNIAQKFSNVKIIDGYFDGFGATKNRAVSCSSNDWVFVLDSDEFFTQELVNELKYLKLEENSCYKVNRKNLFLKEEVKYSGWNPDWVVRLFNKKQTQFSDVEVHESIITDKLDVKTLNNRIVHYAINDIRDFLLKTYKYSNLQRNKNKVYNPFIIFNKALFAFIRTYILKLGFLDGYKGLIISIGNFNGVFFKYMVNYVKAKK